MNKKTLIVIICFFGLLPNIYGQLKERLQKSLQLASEQYIIMDKNLPDTLFPRNISKTGELVTNKSTWWTSGFFPASLWYLYEATRDERLKEAAIRRSGMVEREKLNISDHDIGFKIYCPFGNALRITGDSSVVPIIITAAKSLCRRFDPRVGLIRSWGSINDEKIFTVIIDNMMNLELLFAATEMTSDSQYYKVAVAQADKTILEHFRTDGSSYHVIDYDPATGNVIKKRTAQGFADESAWARGQSWGLYGYTVCYRKTGDKKYLDQARRIAQFILKHPRLPADKIPYWDYDIKDTTNAPRDASAAAIMASAFIELQYYVSGKERSDYHEAARTILDKLTTPHYRTALNEKHNFLLKHSVGHLPANSEVDTPLSYADYYYTEAIIRLLPLLGK